MFDSMRRKDQRRWGEVHLRGLMLDGKRKSIEPMSARLPDGDEQCLQQFVNQSPWDWQPVRRALAERVSAEIEPEAWIVDDTGFPKFGKMSVGVARQYSGTLGKVGNCQLGVSINAASEQASCPLDWRLFIPEEWDEDSESNLERREKAKLPQDAHHVEKWRQALEMIDEFIEWGIDDSRLIAIGADNGVSQVWSVQGQLLYILKRHMSSIREILFGRNNDMIFTASADASARIWDLKNADLCTCDQEITRTLKSAITKDSKELIVLNKDDALSLFYPAKNLMTDFRYKSTGITSCFSSDHTQILTSSYDNTARIWDRTGKEILRLVHPLSVKSAEFSLAKNISSLACNDGSARIWSRDGKILKEFRRDNDFIDCDRIRLMVQG